MGLNPMLLTGGTPVCDKEKPGCWPGLGKTNIHRVCSACQPREEGVVVVVVARIME